MQTTHVWDLPTRLFHWLLAAAVVGLVMIGQVCGSWVDRHFRLGYSVLALLLFRLVWGFVGCHWSRLANFFYSPATIWRCLRGHAASEHGVGHNPLGLRSVLGLLGFTLLQVATGLFSDDEIAIFGPLPEFASGEWVSRATDHHTDIGKFIVLALVFLHIAAMVYYRFKKGQNLLTPMVRSDKQTEPGIPNARDDLVARLRTVLVLALRGGAIAAMWAWAA